MLWSEDTLIAIVMIGSSINISYLDSKQQSKGVDLTCFFSVQYYVDTICGNEIHPLIMCDDNLIIFTAYLVAMLAYPNLAGHSHHPQIQSKKS